MEFPCSFQISTKALAKVGNAHAEMTYLSNVMGSTSGPNEVCGKLVNMSASHDRELASISA